MEYIFTFIIVVVIATGIHWLCEFAALNSFFTSSDSDEEQA